MRWLIFLCACGAQARDPVESRAPDLATGLASAGAADLAQSPTLDMAMTPAPFDPDASCVTNSESATIEYLPVDIIWVIDNSVSMEPAVDAVTDGLNQFASLIAGRNLDYKILMVSLRAESNPVTSSDGKTRYGVCVPPPLAGDTHCGNGLRFFHTSVDIRSTQPLEQFLGTLGQTSGYTAGELKGGDPWRDQLRPGATKTIVVVSDDNSRFTADQFEHFAGGVNPNNSNDLPPGILDASWGGLFDGYSFDGIYGWGDAANPSVRCSYPDGTQPPSAGPTYSDLVSRSAGVRAHICDPASSWMSFFDSVAQAVSRTARIDCALTIPTPDAPFTLDPGAVNVSLDDDSGSLTLKKVSGAAACASGGWYYDDEQHPTQVLLCPSSCTDAQSRVESAHGKVEIRFGCSTIVG